MNKSTETLALPDIRTAQRRALTTPAATPFDREPVDFIYQVTASIRIGLTVNK